MKILVKNKTLWVIFFSLFLLSSYAEEKDSLAKKLDDLHIPDDKVTPILSQDQLYIVNTRYSSLINRHELTLQGAHNFTSKSHLKVQQAALAYRYHFNSQWSFGLRYTRYTNGLTSAGERLLAGKKIVPDTDFALNAQELFVSYNTIYGKLRWSKDTVVYFDQYISLGGGQIELASGRSNHGFLDLGFAFWLGKQASFRIGVKNEGYDQALRSGEQFQYNAMGYLEIGYLFGSGDRG